VALGAAVVCDGFNAANGWGVAANRLRFIAIALFF
jgi:hypothetical protein